MSSWKLLHAEVLLSRPWLTVHREQLELPSGARIDEFHRLETPDWTAVVALTSKDELILVDQYRRGLDAMSRELPAGMIEAGEPPLEAAKRELLEETGFASEDWVALGVLAPEPSRSTARAHLYLARNARRIAPQELDVAEDLSVHLVPRSQALEAAGSGGIIHGTHLAALFLAQRKGLL